MSVMCTERSLLCITSRHAPYCWLATSLFWYSAPTRFLKRFWKNAYTTVKTFTGITIAQRLHVGCVIFIGSPSWFKPEIFPIHPPPLQTYRQQEAHDPYCACRCILHPLNINHLSFIDWFNPIYGDNEACYTKSIPDVEHLMLGELRWNVGLFSISYCLYNSSCLSIRHLGVKKTESSTKLIWMCFWMC